MHWVLCKIPLPPKGLCKLQHSKSQQRVIFSKAVAAGGGKEPWVLQEGLPRDCGADGSPSQPSSGGQDVLCGLC